MLNRIYGVLLLTLLVLALFSSCDDNNNATAVDATEVTAATAESTASLPAIT